MSTTLTITQMEAELSRRVPIGYTAPVGQDALNGALRWINQQGCFPWLMRRATIVTSVGTEQFTLPPDFDPGKMAVLYGGETSPTPTEIPFKTWADAVKNQVHQTAVAGSGIVSCWSFYAGLGGTSVTLYGALFPASAVKTGTYTLVYHSATFPVISSGYFPTPDHFDYLIVELAEAEIMRQYRLAGWDVLYKRVTDQLRAMLGAYTTTKIAMAPSPEVNNVAQTAQALRVS